MQRFVSSLLTLGALSFASCLSLSAQSFDNAAANIQRQLDASLETLGSVRNEIAEKKIPLSREISTLESDVIAKRRQLTDLQKLRDNRSISLERLQAEINSLRGQQEFAESQLNEFVRNFGARLHISEMPLYSATADEAVNAPANVNLSAEEKLEKQLAVVSVSLDRLEQLIDGHIYPGEALADGTAKRGKFINLGPTVFFSADDGSIAGLTENVANAADAVVVTLPPEIAAAITGLADGSGIAPLDPTLGKAVKIAKANKTMGDYIRDGGEVGYAIIFLGAIALIIALVKVIQVFSFRAPNPNEVDVVLNHLREGKLKAAREKAESIGGAAGNLLSTGVEHFNEKRLILEELLFEKVLSVRPRLESMLPFLAIVAGAAPLMGLLGTVIGMIKTFNLITLFGTGDAKALSSGISEALVTTALGLIVAIPILIIHGILSRMAKRRVGMMEQVAVSFVNGVSVILNRKKAAAQAAEAE